ncbi:cobalamin-binding protein [Panacagrimonas sp.]|uniref:cobalamin-binding protein n=1 Tax=Panacagrimonas sp. TaxID=2480088 RepID=UPI003B520AF9
MRVPPAFRAVLLLGAALTGSGAAAGGVVTLAPHLAELVCAAGACDQLVGVGRYSDYPPEIVGRTQVGDAFAVNLEAVLALQPDLVLAWDGGMPPATIERLRSLGLNVESLRVRRIEDIGLALLRIGGLLGTEDAACAAEAEFRRRIQALREAYRDAEPIRVLYQLGREPVYTIGAQSPISEAIELCSGINVFADLGRIAGAVGREAVIAADPDAIVFGSQDDAAGIRASWAAHPRLRAVARQNLYAINADVLARATPRMAQGIEQLCQALDQARARLNP